MCGEIDFLLIERVYIFLKKEIIGIDIGRIIDFVVGG